MTAVKNALPDRATFAELYAGEAPWDIGKPQSPFVKIVDRVLSPLLDAGCGTGENALFFAERGCKVTVIDFLEEPIRRARQKAEERGFAVQFQVLDALELQSLLDDAPSEDDEEARPPFASIIDCGLFHVFSDEDRSRYVRAVGEVIEAGGRVFLMCFSDAEP